MTGSLDCLGQRRFGVFTSAEADAAGLSERQRRTLLSAGRLIRLRRGIFVARPDPDRAVEDPALDIKIKSAAAVLAVKRYAAVSHETAAAIHGLDMLGPPPGIVHLTHPRSASYGISGINPGILTHCASLPESHLWQIEDLPVTSIARTLSDLARRRDPRESLPMIDSALRLGKATLPTLQKVFGDCATWPGHRRAESVLKLADPKAESALESLSRLMFVEQNLPVPESQISINDEDGFVGRVDFLWRTARVVGEADGMVKYTEPKVLRLEKIRQERLERIGYRVVRWLWHELRDVPETIATRIRAAGVT